MAWETLWSLSWGGCGVNSWWMYLLGIIVVLFVLGISVFFIIKTFKDAKELNMDTKMLKKVIFNSAIFTILPFKGPRCQHDLSLLMLTLVARPRKHLSSFSPVLLLFPCPPFHCVLFLFSLFFQRSENCR